MIVSYLKYRRKAQGKYHLHSPLVYELYEKVLEPSMSFRQRRSGVEKSPEIDDGFYKALDKNLKSFVNDNPLIFKTDDVVMIVNGIHRDKRAEADWERLKADEKVRLSIDCWRFGLIFIMDRIKKEHYILKV